MLSNHMVFLLYEVDGCCRLGEAEGCENESHATLGVWSFALYYLHLLSQQ